MSDLEKMQAILNQLAQIPLQQTKCLNIDASEALAKCTSRKELDFYYNALCKREVVKL